MAPVYPSRSFKVFFDNLHELKISKACFINLFSMYRYVQFSYNYLFCFDRLNTCFYGKMWMLVRILLEPRCYLLSCCVKSFNFTNQLFPSVSQLVLRSYYFMYCFFKICFVQWLNKTKSLINIYCPSKSRFQKFCSIGELICIKVQCIYRLCL
jgi:hypothetical protein